MTTQRSHRYWFVSAAVLVMVAAVAIWKLARLRDEGESAPERVARAIPVQGNGGAAVVALEPPALANPPVDIARVEAALARVKATTARISREQIIEEQKRMVEAKARFEAIKIPEPAKRTFTDQNGTRWIELRYESGELRYELAPEPETPVADSPR